MRDFRNVLKCFFSTNGICQCPRQPGCRAQNFFSQFIYCLHCYFEQNKWCDSAAAINNDMIYTRELYTWTVRRPHETWGMHGGHWGGGRGGQRNRAPARVFHRQVRQPWRRRPWPDNLGARPATHKRALLISGIKATSLGGLLRDSLQANAKRTQSGRRQAWLNAVTSPNLRGDYVTPTWSAYISL